MKYFIVAYDREASKSYEAFHNQFVKHPKILGWWHHLLNSYVIATDDAMNDSELANHFDAVAKKTSIGNRHLLFQIDVGSYNGFLPTSWWDWFKTEAKRKF